MPANNNNDVHVVRVEASQEEVGAMMLSAGVSFAKRHYVATSLYLVGLTIASIATGFAVSATQMAEFNRAAEKIDFGLVRRLEDERDDAYQAYYNSKGWFFSCDETCTENHKRYRNAESMLVQATVQNDRFLSEARSRVGIFSEFGVQDTREAFWDSFRNAVAFAKRMSYYDALVLSINSMSRDDTLFSVVVRWFFQVAINFTVGMLTAFFAFAVHVARLLVSYQTSPLTGVGFFIMALAAAGSFLASFVVGLYIATAAATYVTMRLVGPRFRIEFGGAANARRLPAYQFQQQQQQGRYRGRVHEE